MLSTLLFVAAVAAAPAAEAPRTLRLDYFHTASASEERFARDGVVSEGPWPGNPARPIDDTNLGKYLFEVIDRATNRTLYSRGFASHCGEWETTDEAKREHRTFHESLRFPEPKGPVQVKADFNVWAIDTPSEESGVARPSDGVHRHSALRAAYDAFGSERYVLAFYRKFDGRAVGPPEGCW